jgi:hypothetical protein
MRFRRPARDPRRALWRGLLGTSLLIAGLFAQGCGGDMQDPADEAILGERCFSLTAAVERWRELVEKHFKKQHVTWALNIIACESGGNPNAKNASSGASGLFQHMPQYWASRAAAAGFPGASIFDPEANIAASAHLLYAAGGGPQHWSCKYSPFEDPNYKPQFYDNGVPVNKTPPAPTPTEPCPSIPSSGGILDDTSTCFEMNGPTDRWHEVSGQGNGAKLHWMDAVKQSAPGAWARWKLTLQTSGRYAITYFAVPDYAKATSVRYTIRHGGEETPVTVDQSSGGSGSGWRVLGTFDFAQGGDQHVAVYDNTSTTVTSGQHIVVDAIQLVRADEGTPPSSPQPTPSEPTTPKTPPDPQNPQDPQLSGEATIVGGCNVAGRQPSAVGLPALLLLILWARRRSRGERSSR